MKILISLDTSNFNIHSVSAGGKIKYDTFKHKSYYIKT